MSAATTRARAAVKRAAGYRRIIRSMEETRRLNLQELWEEAARQPYDDHDIDDVLAKVGDLRWTVDCIKEALSHLSEDARNEYHRVFDALIVGERPDNGAP